MGHDRLVNAETNQVFFSFLEGGTKFVFDIGAENFSYFKTLAN